MGRILLVQSRTDPTGIERERNNFRRTVGDAATLEFLSALDERLAWTYPDEFLEHCDGVIFGGSADFDLDGGREEKDPARLMAFIVLTRVRLIVAYALAEEKPVLGVCFGHQLIAKMHGADVVNDATQSKFGSYDVRLTEEGARDALFGTLPGSFSARYQHKDSVVSLPRGATLLADGPSCRFSALRYGSSAYTVQFHPELRCVDAACTKEHPPSEASSVVSRWIGKVPA